MYKIINAVVPLKLLTNVSKLITLLSVINSLVILTTPFLMFHVKHYLLINLATKSHINILHINQITNSIITLIINLKYNKLKNTESLDNKYKQFLSFYITSFSI